MPSLLRVLCNRFPEITEKEHFARIVCGEVSVAGETIRDPRHLVREGVSVEWKARRFVSRGGDKLQAALSAWRVPVQGLVFVDAGASTGGFTDCLLQSGARVVHTVDVGYNQLDFRLRRDPRVVVHERTNLMAVEALDPQPHAGVADLSFRSLRGAAAHLLKLTVERWSVVLVKPQFELDPATDGEFDGVVRDRGLLLKALLSVRDQFDREGIAVAATLASPTPGRRGNREFLFLIGDPGGPHWGNIVGLADAGADSVETMLRRQVAELPAGEAGSAE